MAMTISGSTGVTYPDGSSQASGQQACKAWVNFNGTGTVAIRAAYNVSSITDNATGDYTVNFTTAFADANYCVTAACSVIGGSRSGNPTMNLVASSGVEQAPTTSNFRFDTCYANTAYDPTYVYASVFR
jgi:hypothetical protein